MHSSMFTSIHVFCASCFDEDASVSLEKVWSDETLLVNLQNWLPHEHWKHRNGSWKIKKRFIDNGLLLYVGEDSPWSSKDQYIHFSEKGLIEFVDGELAGNSLHSRVIEGTSFEQGVLCALDALISAMKMMNAQYPLAICLSIRYSRGSSLLYDNKQADEATKRTHLLSTVDREWPLLTLPITILQSDEDNLTTAMKLCFNRLARAGGYPGSPRYSNPIQKS